MTGLSEKTFKKFQFIHHFQAEISLVNIPNRVQGCRCLLRE